MKITFERALEVLEAMGYELEQAEQEPVADAFEKKKKAFADCKQKVKAPDDVWTVVDGINFFGFFSHGWEYAKKLYAAPVRTKDLTDDELDVFFNMYWQGKDDADVDLIEVFRAVIAADREKNK